MKVHAVSDLHCEFGKMNQRNYTPPECDVVILSGDIWTGVQGVIWANETYDCPVVMVGGNHDFYNREHSSHVAALKAKAEGTNVHFLENDSVVIDGVRFLGATLWTDYNLFGRQPLDMLEAQNVMADFRTIFQDKDNGVYMKAHDFLRLHQESVRYLTEQLSDHDGKTVVVTHHAPSSLSIHDRYMNDPVSAAYASRLEHLMLDHAPVLWTHGHVHSSFDYKVGDTRVVCNPRGYVGHELNPDFNDQLVIEV